jgi:hypothetical protein
MSFCSCRWFALLLICSSLLVAPVGAQTPESSSSNSPKHIKKPAATHAESGLDAGTISTGLYRNKTFAFTCKVPAGWVLRTEEMNAREEEPEEKPSPQGAQKSTGEKRDGRVLLAAFSRPPEAHGEDVNSSILIAAESVAAYPGLKEAVQYLGPVDEVAKAQGFTADEDPYEIAIGAKNLVRADFHKDVGSRVMRQSTLVMLAKGYAVSITVIGGTEDEVEELIDGLEFAGK